MIELIKGGTWNASGVWSFIFPIPACACDTLTWENSIFFVPFFCNSKKAKRKKGKKKKEKNSEHTQWRVRLCSQYKIQEEKEDELFMWKTKTTIKNLLATYHTRHRRRNNHLRVRWVITLWDYWEAIDTDSIFDLERNKCKVCESKARRGKWKSSNLCQ